MKRSWTEVCRESKIKIKYCRSSELWSRKVKASASSEMDRSKKHRKSRSPGLRVSIDAVVLHSHRDRFRTGTRHYSSDFDVFLIFLRRIFVIFGPNSTPNRVDFSGNGLKNGAKRMDTVRVSKVPTEVACAVHKWTRYYYYRRK